MPNLAAALCPDNIFELILDVRNISSKDLKTLDEKINEKMNYMEAGKERMNK